MDGTGAGSFSRGPAGRALARGIGGPLSSGRRPGPTATRANVGEGISSARASSSGDAAAAAAAAASSMNRSGLLGGLPLRPS